MLLIDLQEEQRQDPQYKAFGIDEVLGNAARLLEAARTTNRMVVHSVYRRDFAKSPPRPFEPTSTNWLIGPQRTRTARSAAAAK